VAEYDGRGRSRGGSDPLAEFDAFRARRFAEQEADGSYEATVPAIGYGSDGAEQYGAGDYGPGDYGYAYPDAGAVEPTRLVAGGHGRPPGGRGRLRSTAVLLAVALFAVGLGAGVYAATRPSSSKAAAASASGGPSKSPSAVASAMASADGGAGMAPGMGPSMTANPGMSMSMDPDMGMGMGSGMGSGVGPTDTMAPGMSQTTQPSTAGGTVAELAVLEVGNHAFTALTVQGATVTVRITGQTQFGTQARPFSQTDLVPGAQVLALVRRGSNGQYVAAVIAGMDAASDPSAQMSPTDDGSGNG
jgi:hypothetical protein